jgi:hypothetical protein
VHIHMPNQTLDRTHSMQKQNRKKKHVTTDEGYSLDHKE